MSDYYLRADGSAANKEAATSDLAAITSMSIATLNAEAAGFLGADVLKVSDAGGIYRDTLVADASGSDGSPITYEAVGSPKISGADIISTWTSYDANTWQATLNTQCYVFLLDGVWLDPGSDKDTLDDHEWIWEGNVLYFRDETGDPDGSGVVIEAAVRETIIDLNTNDDDYLTFEGIECDAANGHLVDIGGDYVILDTCTFKHCEESAGSGTNGAVKLRPNITDTEILTCDFSGIRNDAIYAWKPVNLVIDGCTLGTVYDPPSNPGFGSDLIHLAGPVDAIIQNNVGTMEGTDAAKGCLIILHNDASYPASGCLAQGNSFDHGNYGISVQGDGHTVRKNVCRYQGVESGEAWAASYYLSGTEDYDDTELSNNLSIGAVNGLYAFGARNHTNLKLWSNTFVNWTGFAVRMDTSLVIGGESRNNILWGSDGSGVLSLGGASEHGDGFTMDHDDLGPEAVGFVVWLDSSSHDTLVSFQVGESEEANGISADPLFINATGFSSVHFTRGPGSPCTNQGTDVGLETDFFGTAITGDPDIGFYEFVSAGSGLEPVVIAFLDDLPCEGGNLIARVCEWVRIQIERSQNGRHIAVLTAPQSAAWVGSIQRGHCLHTRLHNGLVFDWRVQNIEDGMGPGQEPVVVIQCDPVDIDMIDCGPIRTVTAGGLTSYLTEWNGLTVEEMVDDIILPALQDYGFDYIAKGTIDPTSLHTGSADLITPRELLKIIESLTGAFSRLRPDGLTGYFLDIVDSLAPNTDVARARASVNLKDIVRTRDAEDLATVFMVRGMVRGSVRASIGMARWEVTAILVGATDRLTLADPGDGGGPILEDDQFVGNSLGSGDPRNIDDHYIVFPDGSVSKIADSQAANQYVWIVDSYGLSTGDLVYIAPDSDGTILTEVHSPSGLDSYGRVCRYFDLDDEPGFSNLLPNPVAATWTDKPDAGIGKADGDQTDPAGVIEVIEGTPNFVIENDAWLLFFWISQPIQARILLLSAGDTLDASGEGTITGEVATDLDNGSWMVFWNCGDGDKYPDGWSDVSGASFRHTPVQYRPADQDTTRLVGTVEEVLGSWQGAMVGSLTPGDRIYAGDKVTILDTDEILTVIHDAVVESDGTVRILFNARALGGEFALSTAIWVDRVVPPDVVGGDGWLWMLSSSDLTLSFAGQIQSALTGVRYIEGLETVYATAGFWVVNNDSSYDPLDISEAGGDVEPMEVAIWDGASELASEKVDDFELALGESATKIVRTSSVLTADDDLAVRARTVKPPAASALRDNPTTYLLWMELQLTDGTAPTETQPAWGNAGVRLHQAANLALDGRRTWPTSVSVSARELAEYWVVSGPDEVRLDLGQAVRVTEPTLGIDEQWVVTKIRWHAEDPENPVYELGKRRKDYTERVVEALEEARG